MSTDIPKKPPVLPVRTGRAVGHSVENRAIAAVGGADTIRTKIIRNADNSETRLRTRGGFPSFYTEESVDTDEDVEMFAIGRQKLGSETFDITAYNIVQAKRTPLGVFKLLGPDGDRVTLDYGDGDAAGHEASIPALLNSDGRGKWVAIGTENLGVNPDRRFGFSVYSGRGSTYKKDYDVEADNPVSRCVQTYLGVSSYLYAGPIYPIVPLGSCRVEGGRREFMLEAVTLDDRIDANALELSFDETDDISGYTTAANRYGVAATEFFVRTHWKMRSYDKAGAAADHPLFPMVSNRSYVYSGHGFFSPGSPIVLFTEYEFDYDSRYVIETWCEYMGGEAEFVPKPDTPPSIGSWGARYRKTSPIAPQFHRLVAFVLSGSTWTTIDISSFLSDTRAGEFKQTFWPLSVEPISSTKALISTRHYYLVDSSSVRLKSMMLNISTGGLSLVSSHTFVVTSVNYHQTMDIAVTGQATWIELVTKRDRASGPVDYDPATAFQSTESCRFTANDGASFTPIDVSFFGYGFEVIKSMYQKPAGDLTGILAIVVGTASISSNNIYENKQLKVVKMLEGNSFKVSTNIAIDSLWGVSEVGFLRLGFLQSPAPVDPVFPWRRDTSKTAPSWWSA